MNEQHTTGRLEVVNDTGSWNAEYDGDGTSCHVGVAIAGGPMVALAIAYSPNIFADPDPTANARRLAACWNACEGINTLLLEQLRVPLRDLNGSELALLEQRDELLAAIGACRDAMPETAVRVNDAIADPLSVPDYVRESVSLLVAQREELLAAVNGLLAYFESGNSVPVSQATIKANSAEVLAARAAIAKAGGEA